ncbi:hypothetical protein pipiens_007443 [Culex pipiens pipiens]|uniref:Uncharacterized protein n=1 Tax=Culex pipiens pipiens TaxID=38569 RepID=A0ABD1DL10_CULPP
MQVKSLTTNHGQFNPDAGWKCISHLCVLDSHAPAVTWRSTSTERNPRNNHPTATDHERNHFLISFTDKTPTSQASRDVPRDDQNNHLSLQHRLILARKSASSRPTVLYLLYSNAEYSGTVYSDHYGEIRTQVAKDKLPKRRKAILQHPYTE